ncbi:mucin-4 isoform X2 [Eurosta solidaginis]|uniref:mucin-4 isoform X2 n=1 Tax=Eurosta solidaginis TaxID=178769 RepID=UPI0035309061
MSLNITVNGKFRACNKPSILDDPVRVKKQLECELRKQRLLEVREESKNIARKIRNDVAAEKDKQLRNLEAMKAQELECWREHVLVQKNNDYRQAIFEIGTAHRAAKLENEAMEKRRAQLEQQRKQFKKNTYERLGAKPTQYSTAKKSLHTAGTQTSNVLLKEQKKKRPRKRKRKNCPKNHISTCHCSSAESETLSEEGSADDVPGVGGNKRKQQQQKQDANRIVRQSQQENHQVCSDDSIESPATKSVHICPCPKVIKCPCDVSSTSSSPLSTTCTDEEEIVPPTCISIKNARYSNKNARLSKNPAVIVDIDVDNNDSVVITHGGEIKDRHAESNRQFSHVVRDSSAEKRKRSSLKSSTTTNISNTPKISESSVVHKPRFTQVSKLLNGRGGANVLQTAQHSAPPPSVAGTTPSTSIQKSPHKSSTSAKTADNFPITVSRGTVVLDGDRKSESAKSGPENSGSQVQCYDYNNKYHRNYPHPTEGLVREPSVRERNEPNAVEQAGIEREMEKEREREKERRRERSEERGRRALEREQVRRDCLQLTEKLDALTDQYPQLLNPPNINLHSHQLQAQRAEKKRNAAVEELLLRPAIITCPEIAEQPKHSTNQQCPTTTNKKFNDDLNLGAPGLSDEINITGSTDSCGTILLGYVDDQQQKIRNDLHKYAGGGGQPKQNVKKAERLLNLLERIEDLRRALCEELGNNGNSDGMEQVINGVSDVRRERERIAIHDLNSDEGRVSPLAKHLHDVEQKEAVLEQKLRELCKMRKPEPNANGQRAGPTMKSTTEPIGKECRIQTTANNKPLEIIIKLKNEGGRRGKSIGQKSTKSPRKLSTLIDTPTRRVTAKRSQQHLKHPTTATQGRINRQNSYDSNSTSYRSLPPRITNEVDALVNRLELSGGSAEEDEEVDENAPTKQKDLTDSYTGIPTSTGATHAAARQTKSTQRIARLNPLIAHYVQRLLGMSRSSIRALGVSSSDIETPSSSVMNISTNRTGTSADMVQPQERIQRVQRFIEDNRSFINELEDTLRSQQSDVTLETSIRMFEEIWQQRLRMEKGARKEKPLTEQIGTKQKEKQLRTEQRYFGAGAAKKDVERDRSTERNVLCEKRNEAPFKPLEKRFSEERRASRSQQRIFAKRHTEPAPPTMSQMQQQHVVEQRAQPVTKAAQQQQEVQRPSAQEDNKVRSSTERASTRMGADSKQAPKESQPKRDISVNTEERRAEEQIARYEQLTENCTHRIAELTELIQKVRTEKKRLMEITLSSVSEERNSTEYIELPDGTRRRSNASSVSSSRSSGASILDALKTQPTTSLDYMPSKGEADSSEQQAITTSGEGISTLGHGNAPLEKHKPTGISRDSGISISRPLTSLDLELPSQASTGTHPSTSGASRKNRPPPTIQRYSPNFAEDDVVHELSTILEVDTPGTSRVNATTTGSAVNGAGEAARQKLLQPQPFPTFEEYARAMNLDVTQLNADTSLRIHQEFDALIANLRAIQGGADYHEFPSLTAYLHNLSTQQENAENCGAPETIDDLLACLRIANLSIKTFPSRQEYLRQLAANSTGGEFLDTGSLENITDARTSTNTETESESINIEEELRRRQILQKSFRVAKGKEDIFSSTAREGVEHARGHLRTFNTESGIEKLSSTSENASSEFERQLFSLGIKWPASMRARTKEADAVGRSNTSSSPERVLNADGCAEPTKQRERDSPRKAARDAQQKNPQQTPKASAKCTETITSTTKEVQFEEHTRVRSPSPIPARSVDQKQSSGSSRREVSADATANKRHPRRSTERDLTAHDASGQSKSPRGSPHRSSDCEFVSDFGRPLNLRDFLTKELLKHATSSSSTTPTDESLRSGFLRSIIDTMTPRTNNGGGSNQLDRQKTSTPVTHSVSHSSSGNHSGSGSAGNTPSQLFSGESCISSVRFFERSITRTYPSKTPLPAAKKDQNQKDTDDEANITGK